MSSRPMALAELLYQANKTLVASKAASWWYHVPHSAKSMAPLTNTVTLVFLDFQLFFGFCEGFLVGEGAKVRGGIKRTAIDCVDVGG